MRTVGWVIVSKDSRRAETASYLARVAEATQFGNNFVDGVERCWPKIAQYFPSEKPLSDAQAATLQLAVYCNTNIFGSAYVLRLNNDLWSSGMFVAVPLKTRFVFESWGAIHFARGVVINITNNVNVEQGIKRAARLTFGARSEVRLPWGSGKLAYKKSFNVMEFIRNLSDVEKEAEAMYAFLSEASHPNAAQNSWFQMAGPPLSNWENLAFKDHGHKLLAELVEILECTGKHIQADFVDVLQMAKEYLPE